MATTQEFREFRGLEGAGDTHARGEDGLVLRCSWTVYSSSKPTPLVDPGGWHRGLRSGRGALRSSTDDEPGKSPEGDQIIGLQGPGLDPDTVQKGPVAAIEVFDGDGIGAPEDPRVVSRDLRVIYTELTGTIPADDDGLIFLEPLDLAIAGPMEDVHFVGIHGERLASWFVCTRTT
jgi:hypothetical protein